MRPRVIPMLLIHQGGVVNTRKFKVKQYIGDPVNSAKLFNELEVDELAIVDFDASKKQRGPDFKKIDQIRQQCFFPLSYGGGITSVAKVKQLLRLGVEKVILNSLMFENLSEYKRIIDEVGAQSVTVSLDVKTNWLRKPRVYSHKRSKLTGFSPEEWLSEIVSVAEPGELLLTSVDADGSQSGYDWALLKGLVNSFPNLPIVINGGAGKVADFQLAIKNGAHGVCATSYFVYKNNGVLINYPTQSQLLEVFRR